MQGGCTHGGQDGDGPGAGGLGGTLGLGEAHGTQRVALPGCGPSCV